MPPPSSFLLFFPPSSILSLSLLVSRFAQTEIRPKVREMDEKQALDKKLLKGMFEQGVCCSTLTFLSVDLGLTLSLLPSSTWPLRSLRSTVELDLTSLLPLSPSKVGVTLFSSFFFLALHFVKPLLSLFRACQG